MKSAVFVLRPLVPVYCTVLHTKRNGKRFALAGFAPQLDRLTFDHARFWDESVPIMANDGSLSHTLSRCCCLQRCSTFGCYPILIPFMRDDVDVSNLQPSECFHCTDCLDPHRCTVYWSPSTVSTNNQSAFLLFVHATTPLRNSVVDLRLTFSVVAWRIRPRRQSN
jgi:hypothetical protein